MAVFLFSVFFRIVSKFQYVLGHQHSVHQFKPLLVHEIANFAFSFILTMLQVYCPSFNSFVIWYLVNNWILAWLVCLMFLSVCCDSAHISAYQNIKHIIMTSTMSEVNLLTSLVPKSCLNLHSTYKFVLEPDWPSMWNICILIVLIFWASVSSVCIIVVVQSGSSRLAVSGGIAHLLGLLATRIVGCIIAM